jgi:hypothetical protein
MQNTATPVTIQQSATIAVHVIMKRRTSVIFIRKSPQQSASSPNRSNGSGTKRLEINFLSEWQA